MKYILYAIKKFFEESTEQQANDFMHRVAAEFNYTMDLKEDKNENNIAKRI